MKIILSEEKTLTLVKEQTKKEIALEVHVITVSPMENTAAVLFTGYQNPLALYASVPKDDTYLALEATTHAAINAQVKYAAENGGL